MALVEDLAELEPRTAPKSAPDLDVYAVECLTLLAQVLDRHRPPERVRALAACRDEPLETFFSDAGRRARYDRARDVCAGCGVLAECRAWAHRQGPRLEGFWGGETARERRGEVPEPKLKLWADGTPRGRW